MINMAYTKFIYSNWWYAVAYLDGLPPHIWVIFGRFASSYLGDMGSEVFRKKRIYYQFFNNHIPSLTILDILPTAGVQDKKGGNSWEKENDLTILDVLLQRCAQTCLESVQIRTLPGLQKHANLPNTRNGVSNLPTLFLGRNLTN